MRTFKNILTIIISACSHWMVPVNAAETADLEKEIARIRKELESVSSQRQIIKQESLNDSKDHDSYKTRFENRFRAATAEADSISALIHDHQKRRDSLSAVIANLSASQKQYDLLQENFRLRLIAICDHFVTQAAKIPPMSSKSITAPTVFLKSELTSRNTDNIDGLQRLIQIIDNHEELTRSIQIFQGISPTPDMAGTVYRLRIGSLFEAAVQPNGNKYALWNGTDSTGKEIWLTQADPEGAAQIFNAINIREGKTLPAFARVPKFGFTEGE